MKIELKKEQNFTNFPSGTLLYLRCFHNICSYDFVVDSEFLYHLILCYYLEQTPWQSV